MVKRSCYMCISKSTYFMDFASYSLSSSADISTAEKHRHELRAIRKTTNTTVLRVRGFNWKIWCHVNAFFRSVRERDISIKDIVGNLKAFGAFTPIYKGEYQPLLRDELNGLHLARADINDIKLIVLDYYSFFTTLDC